MADDKMTQGPGIVCTVALIQTVISQLEELLKLAISPEHAQLIEWELERYREKLAELTWRPEYQKGERNESIAPGPSQPAQRASQRDPA